MATPLRVLLIEDSEDDAAILLRTLKLGGYDVCSRRVDTASSLQSAIHAEGWDLAISDFSMPGFNGTAALRMIREKGLDTPFLFVSGTIGEDVAVTAMRAGAQDYIMKGNLTRLVPAIEREMREAENRRENKRLEQRLRQSEKLEALGKLVGGIAHDFNNVLGAIGGWAEIGSLSAGPGSKSDTLFRKIREQSLRAAGLTRQLLAFARRQVLEPRNIDLNRVTSDTLGLLENVIGAQIEVKAVLGAGLHTVRADTAQIEQVLMNLCINARDAMPHGGQLLIETSNAVVDGVFAQRHPGLHPGSYVRISVSDTGVGMNAETINHIFEPFFTTKEAGKGTGLGLATVLGIIKQHGGSVEVYSEPGKGSAFHVYLPSVQGAPEIAPPAEESPVRGGSETLLVADDSEPLREIALEVLQAQGYHVLLACDGEEAVRIFEANSDKISLVMLDIVMPKMMGTDAYERIRALRSGVPVIYTSGYSGEGATLASVDLSAAEVLQKPYGGKALARKVRELLDASK